ncbi:MAG: tetratricopeptide repeat protein [Proteobacteria bacterium]|nr:tetratricopeptide repeat protein [Pseudomonadota bacterium]
MIWLLSTLAFAQDDEPDGSITGGAAPELGEVEERVTTDIDASAPTDGEWPARVYVGAKALGLEVDFVGQTHQGVQLVYKRQYGPAKKHWNAMTEDWPGRGIGNTGLVITYQALMMENFDFNWEKSYYKANTAAAEELNASLEKPGAQAWEHFLLGALGGVEAIHMMRKSEFMGAIWRGVEAMEHIDQVKVLAPDFKDVLVGDGLYKYWRSVVTLTSKALPNFGDERADGIADMKQAEKEAVFMGPGATLALAFTWIEEKKMAKALDSAETNHKAYPHNVVNNLVYGRVLLHQKRYREADSVFQTVLEDAPENKRSHYYLATSYVKQDRLDEAESHIDTYMGFALDDYYQAQACHRKADIYWRRKNYAQAEDWYRKAVKTDGYKASKKRLAKIKQMKKDGVI